MTFTMYFIVKENITCSTFSMCFRVSKKTTKNCILLCMNKNMLCMTISSATKSKNKLIFNKCEV